MIAVAALAVVGAYLLGAVPFGLLVVRAVTGRDIRKEGSGNIGASNVYRVAGPAVGALVLSLDVLKGFLPVVVSQRWGLDPAATVAVGLAAIAGHNWSVFLRGEGGKGVATSYGVLLALSPAAGLIAAGIWVAVILITRYASLASLLGVLSVPVVMRLRSEPAVHLAFGMAVVIFAFYRHRANIGRLLRGQELRITGRRGRRKEQEGQAF
ncbi:MAG: glycerol-3-phosphate 1-O-acyltransferase PlsY [Armatimonadetes bacterium]|nr:glycerol-3-phosphate 1-O-acyltransferase PlsY [Armatimonadota bacterium]